jgi:predicted Fe-Mo cluster-binding NifX family protein
LIVAIPVFGSEVSPRFDCAKEIMLFRIEGGKIVDRKNVTAVETSSLHILKILSAWKVQQVICGGIDDFSNRMLKGLGIGVSPWVSGNACQALEEFLGNAAKESRED